MLFVAINIIPFDTEQHYSDVNNKQNSHSIRVRELRNEKKGMLNEIAKLKKEIEKQKVQLKESNDELRESKIAAERLKQEKESLKVNVYRISSTLFVSTLLIIDPWSSLRLYVERSFGRDRCVTKQTEGFSLEIRKYRE